MPNTQSDPIQHWLDLLCQMVPGIGQAVLIQNSLTLKAVPVVHWPVTSSTSDDVLSAGSLAASQNKVITTTISTGQSNDSVVETIIAVPFAHADSVKRTLAVMVKIKPSQQNTVIQILRWGEKWLGLLSKTPSMDVPSVDVARSVVKAKSDTLVSRHKQVIAFALAAMFVVLTFMSGTYRVTASANLEGKIQRAVVAPFDGYVAAAHARAGKTVRAGDVIAELDTQELDLEHQRYSAEINEYDHQYRQALTERNNTQAHIFKARTGQAQAQLNLLKEKIKRSKLVSTIDGVIINGDLSRSLGAPVKTGDVLFEVAPLNEYRLVILVDEKQVVDVNDGLSGTLTLKSMPEKKLPFRVQKVSPVFTPGEQGTAYRVEAKLAERPEGLRPGMEGVAKIDIDERRLGWILFHELADVLRIWAWRWLP